MSSSPKRCSAALVAVLYTLSDHFPEHSRELDGCAEEIEANAEISELQPGEERLLRALRNGFAKEGELLRVTGMSRPQFLTYMKSLMKRGKVETVKQGGKTDMARGLPFKLYRIAGE